MDEQKLILIDQLRRKYKHLYGRDIPRATLNRWLRQANKTQQQKEIKTQ